jgi:hypothetical protein
MELAGASAAFVLLFLAFSLPAVLLAKNGRPLVLAVIFAGLAVILYFAFWFEILDELGIRAAPRAG